MTPETEREVTYSLLCWKRVLSFISAVIQYSFVTTVELLMTPETEREVTYSLLCWKRVLSFISAVIQYSFVTTVELLLTRALRKISTTSSSVTCNIKSFK